MDAHLIALAALGVSAANLLLNYSIYLNNKKKVSEERIVSLETNVDDQILAVGDKLGAEIAKYRAETEAHRRDVELRLDAHSEQIATLEKGAQDAPTHGDLGKLYDRINRVGEDVSELSGGLAGVKNLLNTIHEYLLRGAK